MTKWRITCSPDRTNQGPEKWWLEDYFPSGLVSFPVPSWFLKGTTISGMILQKTPCHPACQSARIWRGNRPCPPCCTQWAIKRCLEGGCEPKNCHQEFEETKGAGFFFETLRSRIGHGVFFSEPAVLKKSEENCCVVCSLVLSSSFQKGIK